MKTNPLTQDLLSIWQAGLAAVDASKLVRSAIRIKSHQLSIGARDFDIASIENLYVLGAGKASDSMAVGLEQVISDNDSLFHRTSGLVNVPNSSDVSLTRIETVPCRPHGSNQPTEKVIAGTRRILEVLSNTSDKDLCIFLISGGASALLELPVAPLKLVDICEVTELLSQSGVPIEELNLVRGHFSQVKRGGLVRAAFPARSVGLILSDVIGGELASVGSGPTFYSQPDPRGALDVLDRRVNDQARIPNSIREYLNKLADLGLKTQSADQSLNENLLIGDIGTAVEACATRATEMGYQCESEILVNEGSVANTADRLVGSLVDYETSARPRCLILGGEPSVKLTGKAGIGGRNTHLVLLALQELLRSDRNMDDICLGSLSTDGEDGLAPASGAVIDSDILSTFKAHSNRKQVADALSSFDSHTFLAKHGAIIPAQTTQTNVGDLRILLVGKTATTVNRT